MRFFMRSIGVCALLLRFLSWRYFMNLYHTAVKHLILRRRLTLTDAPPELVILLHLYLY